jgi:hypothetical protein
MFDNDVSLFSPLYPLGQFSQMVYCIYYILAEILRFYSSGKPAMQIPPRPIYGRGLEAGQSLWSGQPPLNPPRLVGLLPFSITSGLYTHIYILWRPHVDVPNSY